MNFRWPHARLPIPTIRSTASRTAYRGRSCGTLAGCVWSRDNQSEAIRQRDQERARRALWADCERRPLLHDRPIITTTPLPTLIDRIKAALR